MCNKAVVNPAARFIETANILAVDETDNSFEAAFSTAAMTALAVASYSKRRPKGDGSV